MRDFHEVWGYVAIVANAIAGVIALGAWRFASIRGRSVWIATIVAEATLMLQVLVGVVLVSDDRYTVARFHMFYGFVAFVTVGLAYSYRAQMRGRLELLYGLVGLFLMGVGIRAVLQVM
ncbi:MAG TPA: hypothetical protein VFZ83_13905 [Acidimicrobiia bacterium]|nr:hypothetical protein [Acidimicrobiia bacterium]